MIFRLVVFLIPFVLCSCSAMNEYMHRFGLKGDGAYYQHTISHSGETLAAISNWYTGETSNWKVIKKHNPDMNVNDLQLGQPVFIPNQLMVQKQALPLQFVKLWNAKRTVLARTSPQGMRSQSSTGSTQVEKNVKPVASAPGTSYQYDVRSIRGCEGLENTASGLEECARLMNNSMKNFFDLRRTSNASDRL